VVTQQDVLQFIADQTEDGQSVNFRKLSEQFWLSPEAAGDHLRRLWRDRLIGPVEPRPPRFQYRLQDAESIRSLRFRLAARGRARLKWYRRQNEPSVQWPLFR